MKKNKTAGKFVLVGANKDRQNGASESQMHRILWAWIRMNKQTILYSMLCFGRKHSFPG